MGNIGKEGGGIAGSSSPTVLVWRRKLKLKPPFTLHQSDEAFWLVDSAGMRFAFTYHDMDRPIVGTGGDKPSRQVARQLTVQVQKLPELVQRMGETTQPLLSRMTTEERAALRRYIAEEQPGMGEGDALRALAREQLITLGLLPLGTANRGKGNLQK